MNRRILLLVTAPAAIIGVVLCITSLGGAWLVNQLQYNNSRVLSLNVTSLEAAQDLEICLRKLRFYCYLFLVDPDQSLLQIIDQVNADFRRSLAVAWHSANVPEEEQYLHRIEEGFERYQTEFQRLRGEVGRSGPRRDFRDLADANPIRHVVEPCELLMQANKRMMNEVAQESDRTSVLLQRSLVLLGVGGPLSGLILGYGVARGLSKSIYRLSVHVHDMAQHLDQQVASISVAGDGDIQSLDEQLQLVVHRVGEVTAAAQRHQQDLLRAQQLSAVAQLAASVAHEVRNPLMAIKMLVELALRGPADQPLPPEDLRVMYREIRRLERTVQTFLDFARMPSPQRKRCDLRDVVRQAGQLVEARARQQGVTLTALLPDTPLIANVDGGQVSTVLVNLYINALDAMPTGGRLLTTLRADPAAVYRLSVQDTGSGFSPNALARLFTPFVSSKATGTGLGLSISRRIVEDHGGSITVGNGPQGGAVVTIVLPPSIEEHHADLASHR